MVRAEGVGANPSLRFVPRVGPIGFILCLARHASNEYCEVLEGLGRGEQKMAVIGHGVVGNTPPRVVYYSRHTMAIRESGAFLFVLTSGRIRERS